MTATEPGVRVVRHPIRGALSGFFAGFGLALLLISFSVIALGTLTPLVIPVLGMFVGLALALLLPAPEVPIAAAPGSAAPDVPPTAVPPPPAPPAG